MSTSLHQFPFLPSLLPSSIQRQITFIRVLMFSFPVPRLPYVQFSTSGLFIHSGQGQWSSLLLASGKPLSREVLVTEVHSALSRAGLNALDYCSHSFRIGAATTALKAGISDAKIRMLGRWESDAYQLYLRTPREELASVCSSLANCHS
jgi:hypothetical protein